MRWRPRSFAKIGLGSTVLKSIGLSFSISLVVRIVGLFKEAVLASFFGLSAIVDVYILTLLLATFFVGPLAGSISTPLTVRLQHLGQNRDIQTQRAVISKILLLCLLIILAIMFVLDLTLGWFLEFRNIDLRAILGTSNFHRYLLLIALFSVVSVISDAALTAQRRFGTQSSIKFCVPLTIITSCVVAPEHLLVEALFAGTVAGYFFEAVVASLCIRKFLFFRGLKAIGSANQSLGLLLRQWPALATSGLVMSGCVIVDQTMAVLAGEGAVAMISFGNRLTLGLLSLSSVLWTVLFPQFIERVINRQFHELRGSLIGLNILVFVCGLFGCTILAFMSEWITSLVYERGAFTPEDTKIVSQIQIFYFLHIPFYISILINARILNAFEKTKLYLSGNIVLLLCNILLNLTFIEMFGVLGIAMATLVSYCAMAMVWFCTALWLVQSASKNES